MDSLCPVEQRGSGWVEMSEVHTLRRSVYRWLYVPRFLQAVHVHKQGFLCRSALHPAGENERFVRYYRTVLLHGTTDDITVRYCCTILLYGTSEIISYNLPVV